MDPRKILRASRKCANPVRIERPADLIVRPIDSSNAAKACAIAYQEATGRCRRSPGGPDRPRGEVAPTVLRLITVWLAKRIDEPGCARALAMKKQGVPTGRPVAGLHGR